MTFRQFLALEIAFLLTANSAAARPPVLGVVVEASRVHVNTGEVSTGATVYDGDRFTTDAGGMLVLRGDAITLELVEESTLIVRRRAENEARSTEAELTRGSLIFSAERAAALDVAVLAARVHPRADVRTVAQVSITEPKELSIYARRGSLQFSYRGETATIAEGAALRIVLDPPDDESGSMGTVKPSKQRKAFLLSAIGAGVAAASMLEYEKHHHHRRHVESPDRP